MPHSTLTGADGTQDGGISSNAAVQSSSSLISSPPSTTGDVARVSLNLRLPRYPGGATPTSGVATSNQTTLLSGATEGEPQNESAIFDNDETGNMCTYALFEPTASSFAGLPQSMPTITSSSATTAPTCDQTVPSTSSPVVATGTQTRGRGFSLSVEISGSSDRVDSIDLNLDVSGIPVSHLTLCITRKRPLDATCASVMLKARWGTRTFTINVSRITFSQLSNFQAFPLGFYF